MFCVTDRKYHLKYLKICGQNLNLVFNAKILYFDLLFFLFGGIKYLGCLNQQKTWVKCVVLQKENKLFCCCRTWRGKSRI